MHVAKIQRGHGDRVYTSLLVRSNCREGGKVKHDTITNISRLPSHVVDVISRGPAGEPVGGLSDELTVQRSWAHGHVAAVLGTAQAMDLAATIDPKPSRQRDLAMGMIAARGAGGRGRLRGAARIGERVGRVINRYGMAKHFRRTVTDTSFSYERDAASIAKEAELDGFYVIRANVGADRLSATRVVVRTYKGLRRVEQAFRRSTTIEGTESRPTC